MRAGQGHLRRLLPSSVACAEQVGDPGPDAGPAGLPAERSAIAHAVASRRRDYLGVRDCARIALGELGLAPVAIGTGAQREPLWPAGVVGSLTHCAGYRAAAVARRDQVRSVGIDAEPHQPLPDGVLDMIALPEERDGLGALGPNSDRLLFCAKEAVYKAWFPLTGQWLGFEEARVTFSAGTPRAAGGRFTARLLRPGPTVQGRSVRGFDGWWSVSGGLALAAVVVPAVLPDAVPNGEIPPRSRWA